MLCRYFKEKMVIGRDQCYEIFRSNGLVQRKRRVRPKTTNSNHNYYGNYIYPNLLNTTPKFVASTSGSIIVGYSFCPSLTMEGPMKALESAFLFYRENGINISGLIISFRPEVQYCSNQYVDTLKAQHINISMTQCGDPLHNALTERVNNTIKNGWLFDCGKETFNQVEERIKQAVYTYNNIRPHQALKMRTPMEIIKEEKV